jgi:hypothetical protein
MCQLEFVYHHEWFQIWITIGFDQELKLVSYINLGSTGVYERNSIGQTIQTVLKHLVGIEGVKVPSES